MKMISTEKVAKATNVIQACKPSLIAQPKPRSPKVVCAKLGKGMSGMYLAGPLIIMNSRYFEGDEKLEDPKWLSILAHEMEHMRQGPIYAYSVIGELEAWQAGWRVLEAHGHPLTPAQLEIMALPVKMERTLLKHAQQLMEAYAGKAYGIKNRPLYPAYLELLVWLGLKS